MLFVRSLAYLVALAQTFLSFSSISSTEAFLDIVYWEQKPYIFTNKNGDIDGIIPRIFTQAEKYCHRGNYSIKLVNYTYKEENRRKFNELLQSSISYGSRQLENVKKFKAFWAPLMSYTGLQNDTFEKERNLKRFQLLKSDKIVVIVPRSLISFPNKILRGILGCQQIFLFAIMLAVLFGICISLTERSGGNKTFSNTFTEGLGTSLYWSIVSMTTVGYGDITPITCLGRCVAGFWVVIGVMIGCVITATMTDVVTGVSDLSVFGKTVSVLENSYDQKIASDYRARVYPAQSYDEVLELVRRKEVFAAMMNADVAAWYHEDILNDQHPVPLRIIQILPASLYMNCYISADLNKTMQDIFKCMYMLKDEIYEESYEHFHRYCHAETLYIASIIDLFYGNVYVQALLATITVITVAGLCFDIISLKKKHAGKTKKAVLMLPLINSKVYQHYSQNKEPSNSS